MSLVLLNPRLAAEQRLKFPISIKINHTGHIRTHKKIKILNRARMLRHVK